MVTNDQIVKLYDEHDLTIDAIAEHFSVESEAVKQILISRSSKYRKELKREEPELFADDIAEAANRLKSLMYSEHDAVAASVCKFIINEAKGRNNIQATVKGLGNVQINVHVMNDHIKKAKAAKDAALNKVVDVPSEQVREMIAA